MEYFVLPCRLVYARPVLKWVVYVLINVINRLYHPREICDYLRLEKNVSRVLGSKLHNSLGSRETTTFDSLR